MAASEPRASLKMARLVETLTMPPGLPTPKSTALGPRDWSMRSVLNVSKRTPGDLKKFTETVPPLSPRTRVPRLGSRFPGLPARRVVPRSSAKSSSVLSM